MSKFRYTLLGSLIVLLSTGCVESRKDSFQDTALTCVQSTGDTVFIASADVTLGTPAIYPEEVRRSAAIAEYDIDKTEVTNAQFAQFIEATGYITTAERPQPGTGKPGGAVFRPPTALNPNWWHLVEGANWRQPDGPGSTIEGRENDPVVQVSLEDARAYAVWAGRRIPTENEWEYAASAGVTTQFPWGDERAPDGAYQANSWQGAFPIQNEASDGYVGRAPVGCYAPNAFGLYDMIGNVWEWTETPFQYGNEPAGYMIKGGSFLCAPSYCRRDRAQSRQSQEADFSTNHIGFRTVSP